VIWSALRAELPWPDPDQIADLAERLALVCERVRSAALRQPGSGARVTSGLGVAPAEPVAEPPPPASADPFAERPAAAPLRVTRIPSPQEAPGEESAPLWMGAIADEIRQSERSGSPLSLLLAEMEDDERVR